jgi:hypothetical protein
MESLHPPVGLLALFRQFGCECRTFRGHETDRHAALALQFVHRKARPLGERGRGEHLVGGGCLLPRLQHHRAGEDRKPDQRHQTRKGDLLGNTEVR